MTTILIECERLTDGSEVHNVRLGEALFQAVTGHDAIALADKITALIAAHTVNEATVKFQW